MTRRLRGVPRIAVGLLCVFASALGLRAQNLSDKNPPNTISSPQWNLGETMKQPLPDYPEDAKEQRVSGKVDFRILIGFDGAVKDVMVVSGDPLLTPSAEAAVRTWHYAPPKSGDASVQVVTRVQIYFILDGCPGQDLTTTTAFVSFHQAVTHELSCGETFTATVSPQLPKFTFKVIPQPTPPDQFGNPQTVPSDIEVFRGDSTQPIQHLTGCDLSGAEPPREGADWFRTVDMNFDGYSDVFLLTNWGVTGNQFGCVWLYDPASGLFRYSEDFSMLGRYTLEPETKTIFTSGVGGMAGAVHSQRRYRVTGNRLTLIWSEEQNWDLGSKRMHCVVQELRGTKMETIRDEVGTSEDDVPCK
jgi:TonB family protein